MKVVRNVKTKG